MCLAIPAKIIALDGATATVDMEGNQRQANVAMIEDPQIGDFILLHAGFAIRKWSNADMEEYRAVMAELEAARGADHDQACGAGGGGA